MKLADEDGRRRALTHLNETLLVEAAAGTGKTALMAGRCALLLASGVAPTSVAAITFTELAAGELAIRIRTIIDTLLRGLIPDTLQLALPNGLSQTQRSHLESARAQLDELTATTIHGFCQAIIRAYAVEADLDPGAAVMDAPQAEAMFEAAFTRWLRRRLSNDADSGAAVSSLAEDDPLRVVDTLRELARLRRSHPSAKAPKVDLTLRPDLEFRDAVEGFARWLASTPGERRTSDLVDELQTLADSFGDTLSQPCCFADLWRLANPPRTSFMKARGYDWRNYTLKGAWRAVADIDGPALSAAAETHYEACRTAFATLMGHLGGALVAELSSELEELLEDYAAQKRAAASLDFDDLLLKARTLVRDHEEVRLALGERYRHIFVDEFQDTDPVQAEIIFAIAADAWPERWTQAVPRPGSLFIVGDPKQAIYRFRGADAAAYAAVREEFSARDPGSVIAITANFRSAPEILEHVNRSFRAPLSAAGQPGYVALTPTLPSQEGALPRATKISLDVRMMSAAQQRDAEAQAVADVCSRLVGAIEVRRSDGSRTPLRPGDIALLAPTGSELWRYEQALENKGLGVASQAGKALMRRQETQDVLALLRTLADPLDRLAFGAFCRGPMVGLTDARLLQITAGLPRKDDGRPAFFSMKTDPAHVADREARGVLEVLRALHNKIGSTTPAALLAEAAERLNLRVALALRSGDRAGRAIANLDTLITLAKPYGVRGLGAFVADLNEDWVAGRSLAEGRIDESDYAVSLVTIHSAKGLEWPVVIPVNSSTQLRAPNKFFHRQSDNTLHWVLGGVTPPGLIAAQAEEEESAARERERLWYVACTRARDLLVLPDLNGAGASTWARVVDLSATTLPELDLSVLARAPRIRPAATPNDQTIDVFEAQAAAVLAAAAPAITWRRPSDHDADRSEFQEIEVGEAAEDVLEAAEAIGAGRVRGILLHKLLEEMLTGELGTDTAAVRARASVLQDELRSLEADEVVHLDPDECTLTALRALALPDIAALWPSLQPEVPLYTTDTDGAFVAGRADAIVVTDGRIDVVVDWKSDLNPSAAERAAYVGQLSTYMRVTGAKRGVLVYISRDETTWLNPPT